MPKSIGYCCCCSAASRPCRCRPPTIPDLIFRRSTVFKFLTPNDKLATYGLDDPEVEGVACYFTAPEKGGVKGWLGVAEQVSDISLSCRQIGPIRFKDKFAQGEDMFRKRRSLFFKKMQIVRGCDTKRNVLVYMVYSDRLIEGSPKNSTPRCRSCRGAATTRSRNARTSSRSDGGRNSFPAPSWARGSGAGRVVRKRVCDRAFARRTPPLTPPHKGEGNRRYQNKKYRCAIGNVSAGAQVRSSPSARTS